MSAVAGQYRVILTEDGYTTAEGPLARSAALAIFDRMAAGPGSASVLRVVAEDEYQRIWPKLERRNEAAGTSGPADSPDAVATVGQLVTFARREHVGGHVDAIRYTGRNATAVAAAFGARAVRSRWTGRLDVTFPDDTVIPVPRGWWLGRRHLDGEFLVSAPKAFEADHIAISSVGEHRSLTNG